MNANNCRLDKFKCHENVCRSNTGIFFHICFFFFMFCNKLLSFGKEFRFRLLRNNLSKQSTTTTDTRTNKFTFKLRCIDSEPFTFK